MNPRKILSAALSSLLVLTACGRGLTDAERMQDLEETWPGTYDRGTVAESTRGLYDFRASGIVTRYSMDCRGLPIGENYYEWEVVAADRIELIISVETQNSTQSPGDVSVVFTPVVDECGPHTAESASSNAAYTVTKGKLCPENVRDQNHGSLLCDWVPCDEAAERCHEADGN